MDRNTSGRIDFFAYNRERKSFVIFEIKSVYDKNIRSQVLDYADSVEENFTLILLKAKQIIPDIRISNHAVELILFAKYFKTNDYERIKKIDYPTKLITYRYFEKSHILLDKTDNQLQQKNKSRVRIETSIDESQSQDNKFIVDFWQSFFDLQNRQIILQNEDFRLEGPEIVIRITTTHLKYSREKANYGLSSISESYLRKELIKSAAFTRHIKSMKFGNKITSGYCFDYDLIKSYC